MRRNALRETTFGSVIVVLVALSSGCATPVEDGSAAEVAYTIIEPNASIPFGSTSVSGFRVGEDKSLLLDGPGGRWYRATLDAGCRSDLPYAQAIGFPETPFSRIDRFSWVVVDGQRCSFLTFDEIADPRSVEDAAPKS